MNLEFYHLRDEYRALLYSALRLLVRLREFGDEKEISTYYRLLLESPFIGVLCMDNVLSNKGGFTPGWEKRIVR